MNHPSSQTPEEKLLRSILIRSESSQEVTASDHPSDETLALFLEGALGENERESLLAHFAICSDCREIAGLGIQEASESLIAPAARQQTHPLQKRWGRVMAMAAGLLLAVAFWLQRGAWNGSGSEQQIVAEASRLLEEGKFSEMESLVESPGIRRELSQQLLNLKLQALRKIPSVISLATMGRLTQFGVGVDGTVARGAETQVGLREAGELLTSVSQPSTELLLNRGHWALSSGRLKDALRDFQSVVQQDDQNDLGWLGLGLAHYLADDFVEAERDFRRVLELRPDDISARMNLALTLQELDKPVDAVSIWRELQKLPLEPADRTLVEQALRHLGDVGEKQP